MVIISKYFIYIKKNIMASSVTLMALVKNFVEDWHWENGIGKSTKLMLSPLLFFLAIQPRKEGLRGGSLFLPRWNVTYKASSRWQIAARVTYSLGEFLVSTQGLLGDRTVTFWTNHCRTGKHVNRVSPETNTWADMWYKWRGGHQSDGEVPRWMTR
jgi:hypothetical protein